MDNAVVCDAGVSAPACCPPGLDRVVVTPRGERYRLRPISPGDADGLVEFHQGLSNRSTYLRYFRVHPVLSTTEVEHFTRVDYHDRLAMVVECEGRLVAVARFERMAGTDDAEVAFVVADAHQHHGLATLLLDALALVAWERGITTFTADTLVENRAMLDVFLGSGFEVSTDREFETVRLRFPIAPTSAYRAALARREATRGPGGRGVGTGAPGDRTRC